MSTSPAPVASSPPPPPNTVPTAAAATATAAPRKRPTPKNASKSGKPKKPPGGRKRKADHDDRGGTPASTASKKLARSAGKKSHSATPMAGVSPEPDTSDMDEDDDNESVEDENAVYCICRKPDNHTWMIGCDGGCDDWYHGKCVDMRQEDEQLIDKFICPVCRERVPDTCTTWKPMCRRLGCRNPARLKKGSESKYCSDACGKDFMKAVLQSSGALASRRGKKIKSEDVDEDLGPLGGPISGSELKALLQAVQDAHSFRSMGDLVPLTPPDSTLDPDASHKKEEPDTKDDTSLQPAYEPYEQERLTEISARKAQLFERRLLLKSRYRFVMMTRDRATRLKQETKDVCGFDPRLAQDERAFAAWVDGADGRAAMDRAALEDPPKPDDDAEQDDLAVCVRRRCKKHSDWQKIALFDVRFDEAEVGDEMRLIDAEETELKQSALVRARRREDGVEDDDGGVEVVDDVMEDA